MSPQADSNDPTPPRSEYQPGDAVYFRERGAWLRGTVRTVWMSAGEWQACIDDGDRGNDDLATNDATIFTTLRCDPGVTRTGKPRPPQIRRRVANAFGPKTF